MSICPSCQKKVSCDCQFRLLSNGKRVCTTCFQAEQSRINVEKARQQELNKQVPPTQ